MSPAAPETPSRASFCISGEPGMFSGSQTVEGIDDIAECMSPRLLTPMKTEENTTVTTEAE